MSRTYDVAVLGLGAMGSAALCHLARAGLSVVGLEQFVSPHAQGSSHGGSRIIREAYFEDPRYVPLVHRAYEEWDRLERDTGQQLRRTTGGVMIGPEAGVLVAGALASARTHGLQYELLGAAELQRRFPAFHPADDMVGVWEPRAGVLFPERCITTHLELATRAGAAVRSLETVRSWRARSGAVEISTARGTVRAGQLVLACGAWMPGFLDGAELPLAVERVVQAWFEPVSPEALVPERCPVTIWEYAPGRFYYAFPLLDGAVKAALHHQGTPADPERVRSEPEPAELERIREPLRRHMPDADGPLREARVCLYTNTPDEHFVIDRHPAHNQVLIVSACSGHGFKFSSAIGAIVTELVRDGTTSADLAMFGAGRFLKPVP